MGEALNRLARDPSFRVSSDEESDKQLLKEWVSIFIL